MKISKSHKSGLNGWKFVQLDDIAKSSSGGTPKSNTAAYYEGGTIPWLTSGEVRKGRVVDFDNFITKEGLENSSAKVFPINTVLVAMYGATAGQVGILEKEASTNQAICGILPNEKYSSLFLYHYFTTRTKRLLMMGTGAAQPNISQEILRNIDIHLPPLPEQNRIVAVLETWDKAIELLKKKIEIKKEVKQGLMQLLLSGKIRLKGFTEKWETVELGNISNFVNGYTFKSSTYVDDGMYKIITIANVQDGHLLMDKPRQINELPSNISREQILSKGDILISMTGNVGRVCTVDQDGGLLNQRVGKIIPRGINRDLFYLFLHDRRFLKTMIDSAQGGAQGNLSTSDIKLYRFDIPTSMKEQDMLADILTASNKEIQVLESKQKVMQEQKTYLLNNLITGQIRTPENLKIFS
jgi:type I restriction enzyme S subunit